MIHLLRYSSVPEAAAIEQLYPLPPALHAKVGQEIHPKVRMQTCLSSILLDKALHYEYGLFLDDLGLTGKSGEKPWFSKRPDLHFSLTHCEGLVSCAFGRMELGIDAEKIRPFNMDTAKRVCTDREISCIQNDANPPRMFFLHWVLKESYCKAIGTGLLFPMREIEFYWEPGKIQCNQNGCKFFLYENIPGYLIARCQLTSTEKLKEQKI